MRNPFIALALAAVATRNLIKASAIQAFNRGEFVAQGRPTSYAKKSGLTTSAAKRASVKAKNRARHRAACRA